MYWVLINIEYILGVCHLESYILYTKIKYKCIKTIYF